MSFLYGLSVMIPLGPDWGELNCSLTELYLCNLINAIYCMFPIFQIFRL